MTAAGGVLAVDARQQQDRRRRGRRRTARCSAPRAAAASSRTIVGAEAAVDGLARLVDDGGRRGRPGAGRRRSSSTSRPAWPTPTCRSRRSSCERRSPARGWGAERRGRQRHLRAAARRASTSRAGVAVVCGAGINCVGHAAATAAPPASPRSASISGDWGGGWGLAEEALWCAARAEDGRGAPTALAARAARALRPGLDGRADRGAAPRGDCPAARAHELTPVLFAVAAAATRSPARSWTGRPRRSSRMATVALTPARTCSTSRRRGRPRRRRAGGPPPAADGRRHRPAGRPRPEGASPRWSPPRRSWARPCWAWTVGADRRLHAGCGHTSPGRAPGRVTDRRRARRLPRCIAAPVPSGRSRTGRRTGRDGTASGN